MPRPRMWSAPFSPIMIVGAFRLPVVTDGITDESTTRRFSSPRTRSSGSTTAIGSSSRPILHEQEG